MRIGCAAFAEQSSSEAAELVAHARSAATALAELEASLNRQMGGDVRFTLSDLGRFLQRVISTLERAQPGSRPEIASEEGVVREKVTAQPISGADSTYIATAAVFPSRLASREEVTRCIDLVIDFYDRTEPSSPIPHLARRIKRMVPMNFLELMEDLAPSGLKEFRLLAGVPENKKSRDER
jgi:type VI secretion system protein ImpA